PVRLPLPPPLLLTPPAPVVLLSAPPSAPAQLPSPAALPDVWSCSVELPSAAGSRGFFLLPPSWRPLPLAPHLGSCFSPAQDVQGSFERPGLALLSSPSPPPPPWSWPSPGVPAAVSRCSSSLLGVAWSSDTGDGSRRRSDEPGED
ncbi:unnamed protein product, partial [Ectocarpus sp. 8 AP-2014]